MRFENPQNRYIEASGSPWLWTLLFGTIYFAVKGVWTHVVVSLIAAVCTYGISWLIYPFFAGSIIRSHYLRKGWRELR